MNILVLYFSGTGNTKHIAKMVENELKSRRNQVMLFSIEDINPDALPDHDHLIFGFPVYAYKIPAKPAHFIRSIKGAKGRSATVFCTNAMSAGFSMKKASYLLKKAGYMAGKGTSIRMPGSDFMPFLGKRSLYVRKAISRDYTSIPKVADIAQKIGTNERFSLKYRENGALYRWIEKYISKKLNADDKCVKCGLCEKICPTRSIKVDGKVTFSDSCMICFRCVHQCPVEAIQVGRHTAGKFRWKGPDGKFKVI